MQIRSWYRTMLSIGMFASLKMASTEISHGSVREYTQTFVATAHIETMRLRLPLDSYERGLSYSPVIYLRDY